MRQVDSQFLWTFAFTDCCQFELTDFSQLELTEIRQFKICQIELAEIDQVQRVSHQRVIPLVDDPQIDDAYPN